MRNMFQYILFHDNINMAKCNMKFLHHKTDIPENTLHCWNTRKETLKVLKIPDQKGWSIGRDVFVYLWWMLYMLNSGRKRA